MGCIYDNVVTVESPQTDIVSFIFIFCFYIYSSNSEQNDLKHVGTCIVNELVELGRKHRDVS